MLPSDDGRASTAAAADQAESRQLSRSSSLGQLQLDVLPSHGLAEFLEHRDSREAREASCLAASSSFGDEDESRTPSARTVVVQSPQSARTARGAAPTPTTAGSLKAFTEGIEEYEVQLQAASCEMTETRLVVRTGTRRVQPQSGRSSP